MNQVRDPKLRVFFGLYRQVCSLFSHRCSYRMSICNLCQIRKGTLQREEPRNFSLYVLFPRRNGSAVVCWPCPVIVLSIHIRPRGRYMCFEPSTTSRYILWSTCCFFCGHGSNLTDTSDVYWIIVNKVSENFFLLGHQFFLSCGVRTPCEVAKVEQTDI